MSTKSKNQEESTAMNQMQARSRHPASRDRSSQPTLAVAPKSKLMSCHLLLRRFQSPYFNDRIHTHLCMLPFSEIARWTEHHLQLWRWTSRPCSSRHPPTTQVMQRLNHRRSNVFNRSFAQRQVSQPRVGRRSSHRLDDFSQL